MEWLLDAQTYLTAKYPQRPTIDEMSHVKAEDFVNALNSSSEVNVIDLPDPFGQLTIHESPKETPEAESPGKANAKSTKKTTKVKSPEEASAKSTKKTSEIKPSKKVVVKLKKDSPLKSPKSTKAGKGNGTVGKKRKINEEDEGADGADASNPTSKRSTRSRAKK